MRVTAKVAGLGSAYADYSVQAPPILAATFDAGPLGAVSPSSFNALVGPTNTDLPAFSGMTYSADTRGPGRVVRHYLAANKWIDSAAPGRGNVLMIKLPGVYDTATMQYDVRFADGFEFSAGGKLPGYVGVAPGTPPSTPAGGGSVAHGWSGRLMWLGPRYYSWANVDGQQNMAISYIYHPGQPSQWGDNIRWGMPFYPGRWHTVRQRHVMNTIGRADGILQAWIDGRLVVNRSDFVYRTDTAEHITHFDWSVFRGGGDVTWASSRDGYVEVDNLLLTAA